MRVSFRAKSQRIDNDAIFDTVGVTKAAVLKGQVYFFAVGTELGVVRIIQPYVINRIVFETSSFFVSRFRQKDGDCRLSAGIVDQQLI